VTSSTGNAHVLNGRARWLHASPETAEQNAWVAGPLCVPHPATNNPCRRRSDDARSTETAGVIRVGALVSAGALRVSRINGPRPYHYPAREQGGFALSSESPFRHAVAAVSQKNLCVVVKPMTAFANPPTGRKSSSVPGLGRATIRF
jgi:hypothetical protein